MASGKVSAGSGEGVGRGTMRDGLEWLEDGGIEDCMCAGCARWPRRG